VEDLKILILVLTEHLFFLFAVIAMYAITSTKSRARGSANNAKFGCTLDARTMHEEKLVI
jgi:hypothetical protein